jgi:AraC family transcriptional regulator
MGGGFATVTEEEGIRATSADVNGFTVGELRFPPAYVQEEFEPELPYLALVLEGAVEKSFGPRTMHLGPACAVTMPAGATHSARFSTQGARIVIVKARHASSPVATCLDRLADLRAPGLDWLARRLAAELRAPDAAAPLAAEGFALELLAATSREATPELRRRRPPAWLSSAEELLRGSLCDCVRLSEVAAAVGVRPTHLARVFRTYYGVSVGEYGRRLRLAWAAAEIARTDTPLAAIAAEAGFADQSHFTRLFKHYVGTTPARYRAQTRP